MPNGSREARIADQIRTASLGVRRRLLARSKKVLPRRHLRWVFVVHGRNHRIRKAAFEFLSSIQLEPKAWDDARKWTGKPNPYIWEVVDLAITLAGGILGSVLKLVFWGR